MAKYTVELRDLLDNSTIDIGLKDYVLYEPKMTKNLNWGKDLKGKVITNYRDYLNNRLLKHYYFREIGFETGALFVFKLNNAMEEIMPYYNQMIQSTDIDFNPLWNVDLTETFTHNVEDTGVSTSNATGSGSTTNDVTENTETNSTEGVEQNTTNDTTGSTTRTLNLKNENTNAEMNTPESHMTQDDIKAHGYLSKATHSIDEQTGTEITSTVGSENGTTTNDTTGNSTTDTSINSSQSSTNKNDVTSNNSSNRTETYTRKQEGSSAGYLFTQNIDQWRKIMINIEMMIIEDRKIKDCFMQIY